MPRHRWATTDLKDAALKYAERQWAVLPGHYWEGLGCSCGEPDCDRPGTHPVIRYWPNASDDADTIRTWWKRQPYSIILPTGRHFDVLDLPRRPGTEALLRLEILGHQLGPVARTGTGRILVWVRAGGRLLTTSERWREYD